MIIETDLGRDGDDFFAICYLISAGVKIEAVMVTPGDSDQIAVANFLRKELDQKFAIVPSINRRAELGKHSSGGIHYEVLEKYGHPLFSHPDDAYVSISPDSDLFVCGPPTMSGKLALEQTQLGNLTMQGGFLAYDSHSIPCEKLDKFENKKEVPTFNMNGCKTGTQALLEAAFKRRQFVGKNVCHTIVYDKAVHEQICSVKPKNRADELVREVMTMFLENKTGKAFHDPLASVLMLHPEIGTWVQATPYRTKKGEWGSNLDQSNNFVLVDVDREAFWSYIANE